MTVVRCPFCGLQVVQVGAESADPLPELRDGFVSDSGEVLGVRPGAHACTGYGLAVRIYDLAGAES